MRISRFGRRPDPRGALALICALAFVAPAAAQEIAERRFRAAERLEQAGQLEQARAAYRQIVDSAGAGRWAGDALLALARLAWPVDDPDQLADPPAGVAGATIARGHLESLRRLYPDGEAAAEGTWRLALLRLLPVPEHYDREEAVALLTTLPVVYPDSPRVPDALALAARLQWEAGRAQLAGELAFRLLADWPASRRAARASLTIARVELAAGRFGDALAALGRAARQARGDAFAANEALDLATLVDRIAFGPDRGGPLYRAERGRPALPERASDLDADAAGRLYAALPRRGELAILSPDGKLRSVTAAGIAAVALDAWQRPWMAGSFGIRAPAGLAFPLPERTDPVAIAPVAPDAAWIVDRRGRAVLRVEAGAGVVARAELPDRAVPTRVVAVPDGGALVLVEGRDRSLVEVAPDGKPRLRVALATLTMEPVDIARDELGDIYVLDARAPRVVVLTPDGALRERLPLPNEGEGSLARAACLAVDRSGRIAVHETRRRGVQWFR